MNAAKLQHLTNTRKSFLRKNEEKNVNMLRNRIAHHEPICFTTGIVHPDTAYVLNKYVKLQALFSWLGIDSQSLLYGLDHVHRVCGKINGLNVE